ncbi:D-3-phosphoglycerate dehydrogenase [Rhodoligotrophos appendicifer]|uniref:C-terminal binding protein n=1 Tax=Rhodoligotrophos appendicifer TaxID=987056 RepID=UPI00117F31D3|nr:C-terminal binding protein [Rhodoligotrophos appendicifer]
MTRIVVTDSTFGALPHEQAVAARHGAQLDSFQCRTAEEVVAAVEGADAVFVQFAPMTDAALSALKTGATVVRYGVGFDNIDVIAARRLGVQVAYVPDYCVDEVADHTLAMLLSLYRKLPALDASVRGGDWSAVAVSRPLRPAAETVIGFLGLGRIGRAVLARLRPFGFPIMVADPMLDAASAASLGVGSSSFEAMLPQVDALLLHAPVTPETREIINAVSLARMKTGAVIVNCSRGALIDEAALAEALTRGHLGAAALDVFATEPLLATSPLRQAPNLLLSPHAAWYSDAAMDTLQRLAADEIDRALSGRPPRCPVP